MKKFLDFKLSTFYKRNIEKYTVIVKHDEDEFVLENKQDGFLNNYIIRNLILDEDKMILEII